MSSTILDVIVVGAGIMGSCTSYQTAKRGYSTLLLVQFDMQHNRGSSHGESRTLRATYAKPYYTSMGWIGVVSKNAGVIKPTKAVCMFQTLAFQNGAILKDNMKITEISRDHDKCAIKVCKGTGEIFYARKYVITVGAWMNKLVKKVAGIEIPIQPLEITICYWKVKEEHEKDYSLDGGFPTFSWHGSTKIYGTPCMEYPGLIKVCVDTGPVCDLDKRTWTPTSDIIDLGKKFVKERFGGRVEHERPISTQSCMYSTTLV